MPKAPPNHDPGLDAGCSAASLWLVMMKSYRSVQTYVEHTLTERRIGLSDFMILEALLHKGAMRMSQLGSTVMLANPSITAAIARLEKQGLVTRQSSTPDRRVRNVALTAAGRTLIRKAFAQHERDLDAIMADISQQQRQGTRTVLKRIGLAARERLEALPGQPDPASTAE